MRLIDVDATVNGLDIALACSRAVAGKDALQNKALDIFENARNFVANMPTIDAAPVVRCMVCKHCNPENAHCDHPMGTTLPVARKPDDFCSYGERKDGADVQNT